MNRVILRSFAIVVVALVVVTFNVQAQSANEMKADIPFSFIIGNQTLPAGGYTVSYVNQNSGKSALLFRSMDGKTSRIVNMTTAQASGTEMKASLVFNQYGDQYFLSEVWTGTDQYGLSLPKSRTERQMKSNELSRVEAKRVTVALGSRR